MHCWLEGRKSLTVTWGVREQVELHGNELARGRGAYCGSQEQERIFKNRAIRLRAYDLMLAALAGCGALSVTTVCCATSHMPTAYARFVEHLERWAAEMDTRVLVVLDGHAGPADGVESEADVAELEAAHRNARPYRLVHRGLDLRTRRVIEDPIVQDSRSSHLIQAADLVAYAATQWLWVNTNLWPKGGPTHGRPLAEIAKSYESLAGLWLPSERFGIHMASVEVPRYEEALG
ncbi:hypothetical protein Psuf_046550 [Phytohabitans suffuscus]|uniref:Uncharacterized protein n=2 Tax=Phytohabitans suffuscus TaxID=624315 RepID=A0A6F8YMK1_9ACTN|nr:hypothetical protein Psuf_046550 [Phytohabitans suffuscus]